MWLQGQKTGRDESRLESIQKGMELRRVERREMEVRGRTERCLQPPKGFCMMRKT